MRFLVTLALLYVLYLLAKGMFGRKSPAPERRRPEARIREEWEKQPPPPRSQGIDYSKMKDADYRDL